MSANRACDYCEEEIRPDDVCEDGEHHAKDCCAGMANLQAAYEVVSKSENGRHR